MLCNFGARQTFMQRSNDYFPALVQPQGFTRVTGATGMRTHWQLADYARVQFGSGAQAIQNLLY